MHDRHFTIARRLHDSGVEAFIELRHPPRVRLSVVLTDQPNGFEPTERCVAYRCLPAQQTLEGRDLQDHAQLVKLVEALKIEGADVPAGAEANIDKAIALQLQQRVADWCPRGTEAVREIGLGKAVAR